MLYGETPCNPNMAVLDLEEFGKLGRSLDNVLTIVDSTFASPYLQPVIKHGIDISMHSWYVLILYSLISVNIAKKKNEETHFSYFYIVQRQSYKQRQLVICIGCHCSTKYLGGHSDLVAGCLTFGSVDLWKTMIHYQTTLGTSMVGLFLQNYTLTTRTPLYTVLPRKCFNGI